MVNINNNIVFKYINYFTLACIVPIGYFAPIGEWLLIGFFAISIIIILLSNSFKINLHNFYIILISIFLFTISYFFSISTDRTIAVIGPISGIILSIYIILNISRSLIIKNMDNVIGIPLLLTSLCIFSDLVLNTEIRSSLALLVGDKPTNDSGNYSRGIIILTMILPLSVALFIIKKKYMIACLALGLVSTVVFLGPNASAKAALVCCYFSALIIYFLGPKSFTAFGILSLIIIIFNPLISTLILSKIGQLEKNIEVTEPCTRYLISKGISDAGFNHTDFEDIIRQNGTIINNKNIALLLSEFEKLELRTLVSQDMIKFLNDNNVKCSVIIPWQMTSIGSSTIHRLLIWEYVAKEILGKPLLGHGLGTSRLIGQNIILKVPSTNEKIKGAIPLHPHNNFIEIWLELGLFGIIIISLIWIKIIKLGKRIRENSYVLGTGVCSSIVTIFVICNLSFGAFQAWWMASIGLIFLIIFQSPKDKTLVK